MIPASQALAEKFTGGSCNATGIPLTIIGLASDSSTTKTQSDSGAGLCALLTTASDLSLLCCACCGCTAAQDVPALKLSIRDAQGYSAAYFVVLRRQLSGSCELGCATDIPLVLPGTNP